MGVGPGGAPIFMSDRHTTVPGMAPMSAFHPVRDPAAERGGALKLTSR